MNEMERLIAGRMAKIKARPDGENDNAIFDPIANRMAKMIIAEADAVGADPFDIAALVEVIAIRVVNALAERGLSPAMAVHAIAQSLAQSLAQTLARLEKEGAPRDIPRG